MLNDQQTAAYRTNGYLKGGDVIEDAVVDELRDELDRVIRDKDKPGRQPVLLRNFAQPGATIWQVVDIWMASPAFERLLTNPLITGAAAQLSGARQLRLWHDQIQYKLAETGGVNMWHQDWPYWPILDAPHQVTAWVALEAGDRVLSVSTGLVVWVGPYRGFSRVVLIESENGYTYVYGGNEETLVAVGDRVRKGTQIGLLGRNAHQGIPQLYFLVYRDGVPVDPSQAPRS